MSTLTSHEQQQIKKVVREAIEEMLPKIAEAVVERLRADHEDVDQEEAEEE